jgi:hypothetical protein
MHHAFYPASSIQYRVSSDQRQVTGLLDVIVGHPAGVAELNAFFDLVARHQQGNPK